MTRNTVWTCIILALAAVLAGCTAVTPPAAAPAGEATATAAAVAAATASAVPTSPLGCLVVDPSGDVTLVDPCDSATETLRNTACRDVVPFDGGAAYNNVDDTKPLGWSLAVNFNDAVPGDPPACLRLYYRDDTPGVEAYMPIDGGGILVETCKISGNLPITGDYAEFCADKDPKGVVCSVNLAAWISDQKTQDFVAPVYPGVDLPSILANFGSTPSHTYATMALISTVNWDSCPLVPRRMPLITYLPTTPAAPQPQLLLASALSADDLKAIGDGDYNFDEAPDAAEVIGFTQQCTGAPWTGQWLTWVPAAEDQLVAWDQRQASLTSDPYDLQIHQPPLSAPTDSCIAVDPTPAVDLWQSDAKLLIGMETDPPSNSSFLGNVDGVLIDPFDSKPAASADKHD